MIKKIFLLSSILTLSACSSLSERMQCDPEKNTVYSNPKKIEEYKKLEIEGKIKSQYFQSLPTKECKYQDCIKFDTSKYEFIEQYFNDKSKKGIYTINAYKNIPDKNCYLQSQKKSINTENYCYTITKNKNDVIKSRYLFVSNFLNNSVQLQFIDLKDSEKLFDISYQMYSSPAMGAMVISYCKKSKDNNPDYKFNPLKFM